MRIIASFDLSYRKTIGPPTNGNQLAFDWIFRENSSLEQPFSTMQFQEAIP